MFFEASNHKSIYLCKDFVVSLEPNACDVDVDAHFFFFLLFVVGFGVADGALLSPATVLVYPAGAIDAGGSAVDTAVAAIDAAGAARRVLILCEYCTYRGRSDLHPS